MIDEVLSSETHWWFFFAGTIAFFWLMVEGGYWVGRWRREHVDPEQADIAAAARPRSVPVGLYIDALNDVIDRHEERVTVSLHYRIPPQSNLDAVSGGLALDGRDGPEFWARRHPQPARQPGACARLCRGAPADR